MFSSSKIFCGVALFAFVVLPCFECGVKTRKPIIGEENGEFPFIDGLRRRNFRPLVGNSERVGVDDGAVENDDHYPFVNGLLIPTTLPLGKHDESVGFAGNSNSNDDHHPFVNGLLIPTPPSLEKHDESVGFAGNRNSDNDHHPFINGLLIPIPLPLGKHDESVGDAGNPNSDADHYPFINGLRIPTPPPLGKDNESVGFAGNSNSNDDHYPFIDGLRIRTRSPFDFDDLLKSRVGDAFGPLKEKDSKDNSVSLFKNEDHFINGLLRRTTISPFNKLQEPAKVGLGADWMKDDVETRHENENHFINGRLKRPTIPPWILARPEESAKVALSGGDDDHYPFVNGLIRRTRRPRQVDQAEESLKVRYGADSKPSNENDRYPFINGLLLPTPSILGADNSQKSVGLAQSHDDSIFPFVNGLRKVKVASSHNSRRHYTYGKREEGERKVLDKILRKPLRIGSPEIVMYAEYDGENEQNSCPVNFISVWCTDRACDVEKDTVEIVSGGIGEKSFKVKITSHNNHLYKYHVLGFTKCA